MNKFENGNVAPLYVLQCVCGRPVASRSDPVILRCLHVIPPDRHTPLDRLAQLILERRKIGYDV